MWYGRLFGQSLCDVKHDFKSSFVAKWHGIFLGVFQDTTTFLVSQKKVSVGITSTSIFSLISLVR